MKVVIAVHGRFHAFELAGGLSRLGALSVLMTTYPALLARRFLPRDVPLKTAGWLELRRRFGSRLGFGHDTGYEISRRFGQFAASHLPERADIFVGWSGACLEALSPAKRRGMLTIVERGSTHIVHQARVLSEAYAKLTLRAPAIDARLIERELAEYEAAGRIAVGSPTAAETFMTQGIPADRLIINPYGIDIDRFAPPQRRIRTGLPRILFVGSVSVRKGAPILLRAFGRVAEFCELHFVGPIEPDILPIVRAAKHPGIVFRGALRGAALLDAYRNADIFCLPSIEEGLSLAVLQAMGTGLPVIVTPATGITALCGHSDGVVVVEPTDPEALADALERLARDPDLRQSLGMRARRTVEQRFTIGHYVERAVMAYRSLIAQQSGL
jgi:glycosyltransferase involved in cell wall biosynthesis